MCPIRGHNYGGIPSSGGYNSIMEYNVGAARYAEAAHCILGSLGKRVGYDGKTEWHAMARVEEEHLNEEIGIMMDVVSEYSKDVYVMQLNDVTQYKEEYQDRMRETAERAVQDIRDVSPKLIANATEKLSRLESVKASEQEFPDSVFEVGKLAYLSIIYLAEALLESVEDWDDTKTIKRHKNAYGNEQLQATTYTLNTAIDWMIKDLSE
tara:strand:- start:6107 stop:6733 length:627 start_codon:yes stop_codon:yes gene_type:complete